MVPRPLLRFLLSRFQENNSFLGLEIICIDHFWPSIYPHEGTSRLMDDAWKSLLEWLMSNTHHYIHVFIPLSMDLWTVINELCIEFLALLIPSTILSKGERELRSKASAPNRRLQFPVRFPWWETSLGSEWRAGSNQLLVFTQLNNVTPLLGKSWGILKILNFCSSEWPWTEF